MVLPGVISAGILTPMISYQRFIDLLAMSRFANLPTVWSNLLLGVFLGMGTFQTENSPSFTLLALSLSCLYLGGCFLNDWHDADFDTANRIDRPIPSGRWSRQTIGTLAISLLLLGLVTAFLTATTTGVFAIGIVLCIFAYTRWHKVHPASFAFMAGARMLIYPASAFSFLSWESFITLPPQFYLSLFLLALSLGCYIFGISLMARNESNPSPTSAQQIVPILLLSAPALFTSGPLILLSQAAALPALILFILVLSISIRSVRKTKQIGQFVSRALASIPLVDYLYLGPIALIGFLNGGVQFGPLLFIPPGLALLALLFQRIAPAT